MASKILIIVTCLVAMASQSQADILPGIIKSNDVKGLTNACLETITNCQSALGGVVGLNVLGALLLSVQLVVVIQPLLLSLVLLLVPLLNVVLTLVTELLVIVLEALAIIVTLVVKLLSGLISQSDYDKQSSDWNYQTVNKVKSYSNTELSVVVVVVLKLLDSIALIFVGLKIGL